MPGGVARSRLQDLTWALGALLLIWVVFADVSWSFAPLRIRLTPQTNSSSGTVLLPLAEAGRIAEPTLVATFRLRNPGANSVTVESRAGSDILQRTTVAGGSSANVRLMWRRPETIPTSYAVQLTGPPVDWTVESPELSNQSGFSRGLLNVSIVPAAQPVPRIPLPMVMVCALMVVAVSRVEPVDLAGWRRRLAASASVVAVALLAAVAFAPLVSPFGLILSPRTFALCALLLVTPRLVRVGRGMSACYAGAGARKRRLIVVAVACVSTAFIASAMLQTLASYDGNYSGFLHVSRDVAGRAPFLKERPDLARSLVQYDLGYDGEFMYLMAFDPLLTRFKAEPSRYRDVTDTPPYRYGRIGFSALTRLLSAGRPERFPMTMMWLIVGAHFVLAWGLALTAMRHGVASATALLYLAIPGFMASMTFALPEALVAAALVAGLVCLESERPTGAGVCFALAVLIRETSVLMVLGLSIAAVARIGWRRSLVVALEALVPFAVWKAYVGWRLMPDFGGAAFLSSPGIFEAPFAGLGHLLSAGLNGSQSQPEIAAALAFPLIIVAGLAIAAWLFLRQPGPFRAAVVAYGVVAVSLDSRHVWTHLPSGERGTFELFLGLLLTLLTLDAQERRAKQVLAGFFAVLCAYTLLASPEAAISRAALLLIR